MTRKKDSAAKSSTARGTATATPIIPDAVDLWDARVDCEADDTVLQALAGTVTVAVAAVGSRDAVSREVEDDYMEVEDVEGDGDAYVEVITPGFSRETLPNPGDKVKLFVAQGLRVDPSA